MATPTQNSQPESSNPHRPKVAVGMSGGVDSSLTAHLLVEQGYDVTGVFLECWRAPGCRSEQDRKDALEVALSLDIPFKVLDFKTEYKERVVEYFFNEYEAGRTPNPDVICNQEIKFGLFYDWAMNQGFDYIATGHYAKKLENGQGVQLVTPVDDFKDQTYFMYLITEEQLNHSLFPLQDLTKDQVRQEAKSRNIHVANKQDSVGICFIGDINVDDFLAERLGEDPGEVVDADGNVIGSHKGLWFYTIGQRSGFTINPTKVIKNDDGTSVTKHNIPPFYVINKKPDTNQLVVGFGSETFKDSFAVSNLHWINDNNSQLAQNGKTLVRIRHTGDLIPCKLEMNGAKSKAKVKLGQPTKGIAEGQSAVLYSETKSKENNEFFCLGGGVIGR